MPSPRPIPSVVNTDNRDTPDERRDSVVDRRAGLDRRDIAGAVTPTLPAPLPSIFASGLERRRGAGRRLSDSLRSAEEGELTGEQFLFLMAIEAFKRANGTSFPSWSDVLEVVRLLGYRKTCASSVSLPQAEDWTEAPDAPANVRPDGFERRAA